MKAAARFDIFTLKALNVFSREHLGRYRREKFALSVRKIEAFSFPNQYLFPDKD